METTPYSLSLLKPTQLPFKKLLALMAITIIVGLAFGAMYEQLATLFAPAWFGAAVFHTFASIIFLVFLAKNGRLSDAFSFRSRQLYFPSLLVVTAVVLASSISNIAGGSERSSPDWSTQLAFVLWIPIVEEVVFRGGLGSAIQRYTPGIWGMWFSALIFAWVHTIPTFGSILGGHLGLPIGPFLLALICEYLRVAGGGSLVPPIIFHMVCNGSVIAFSLMDARWMTWLGLLYS